MMDAVVSHPQVVFAAERLQQLLVVSVAHLTQEGQQTRHKLSLVAGNVARQEERKKRVNMRSVGHILLFCHSVANSMAIIPVYMQLCAHSKYCNKK